MSDTKLLQSIVNSIAALRKEVKDEFGEVHKNFAKVNERLDKQGSQLAYLEEEKIASA